MNRESVRNSIEIKDKVDFAFDSYMDLVVDDVVLKGYSPEDSIDAVFTIAYQLFEEGVLPEFPDETATYDKKAEWLVKAVEFGFEKFVNEASSDS